MKKLFLKMFIYSILILLTLEVYIRAFHLTKDYPVRYVDEFGVEKWLPNQDGFSVTGNRRQNFSEYHINNFGYNSYRDYNPSKDKIEIALVGDSFIEGFHQSYYNSIGKKIEDRLPGKEVYEFGYAGYDLADQLHLINQYKDQFDLIDHVILGIKFENDLIRAEYNIVKERMKLESPLYKALREIKLLVYLNSIGILDAPKDLVKNLFSTEKKKTPKVTKAEKDKQHKDLETKYLENFKSLTNTYGFDKTRYVFLLDSEQTPEIFLNHLKDYGYKFIDYSKAFKKSKRPTTLIYDMHWNNNGRTLIAELIADYVKDMKSGS